jgi:hypothetical protein
MKKKIGAGGRKRPVEKRKRQKNDIEDAPEFQKEPEIYDVQIQDEDDDGAPEEIAIDKSGADFIPLKSTKRKRKPRIVVAEAEPKEAADEQAKEEPLVKKRDDRFVERFPGSYVGVKKANKFRVIDLSSDANNRSASHKRAMDLKRGMFERHRRVTGTQYLGRLHKTKMIGKG